MIDKIIGKKLKENKFEERGPYFPNPYHSEEAFRLARREGQGLGPTFKRK
jgi:hypothetical protein